MRPYLLLLITFSFALGGPILFPYPLFHYPNSMLYFVLVPQCLIAIRIVLTQAIGLLCRCFLFVGAIGFGCDRSGVGVFAIGRHVGVALLLFVNSVGVCWDDASVKDLIL